MAATPETLSSNQLKQARTKVWHQDGNALRTLDDARTWLETAGLVAFYPHAQFSAAPQPSFAEAVLGRPENGWIPQAATADTVADDEREGTDDGDEADFDEDFDDSENMDDEDIDDDAEDADEDETAGDPEAFDGEVMLSNDDEVAEDEGDEIAEEDRIDSEGNPLPNDLVASEAAEGVEAMPPVDPVNGFTAEEKEVVSRTLARLIEEGSAVPLNLLGSTTGEPDFVCSAQAFSFVYTLRGDKGWKLEPSQTGAMRVSPLAVKVAALLKENGSMAPHELSAELGQGIVDSAVLRALNELWAIQRVIPVPDVDGGPSRWELMSGRFVRHIKAGANAGQPTALSALLSLYLSQAVAATSDEMETFLSPLAARSRVREVVGGLSASRQLESQVVDGKTVLYMPGALDALPADSTAAEPEANVRSRYEDDDRRHMIESRAARFPAEGGERKPFAPREGGYPVRRPAGARAEGDRAGRPGGFGRREGGFSPQRRSGGFGQRREGGAPGSERERRPFTRRDEGAAPPAGDGQRNEFARPWEDRGGERKPFTPREDGERRPFAPREGGERRPFAPREGGERRPFAPREGGERRPFAPRGDRPSDGDRKPFTPREGGERRPYTTREGGERKPFAPRGDRPFTPRGDRPFSPRGDRPFTPRGDRPASSEGRPFTPREGGERRPFTPREGGERRPFTPREGGDRRPFTPREGGDRRPFTPREGGERRPFAPRGDRPAFGERKPFAPREGGDRRPFTPRDGGERRPFTPRGDRPFGDRKPFTPREGGERRPFTPREGGERRPFTPREGGERRPFTPREGRPSFGARKPFGADRGGSGEGRPERSRFSGEPGAGRPSFRSGAGSAGPGGSKFGGSGFGRDRSGGGQGRPGGAPPRRGPGFGPGRGGAPKRRPE